MFVRLIAITVEQLKGQPGNIFIHSGARMPAQKALSSAGPAPLFFAWPASTGDAGSASSRGGRALPAPGEKKRRSRGAVPVGKTSLPVSQSAGVKRYQVREAAEEKNGTRHVETAEAAGVFF